MNALAPSLPTIATGRLAWTNVSWSILSAGDPDASQRSSCAKEAPLGDGCPGADAVNFFPALYAAGVSAATLKCFYGDPR